jgi:putative peptidoglycan lipid II flippase
MQSGNQFTHPEEGKAKVTSVGRSPSLGKTFSVVALLSIVSKVAGLIRDIVVAQAYGTSFLADSYNYAYLFTGNILVLFGGLGGPFHSATVTTLSPKKDSAQAGTLMTQILFLTAIMLSFVTVMVFLLAPYIVQIVAGGYNCDAASHARFFQQTIWQLRVMSPLVLISGLIGISYGILNVYHKIFWPSLSPAIASVAIIIALLLFPNKESALPLAIGTLIGAFGQLFAQLPDMFRCGLKYRFSLEPVEGLSNFTKVLWPVFIGTSIGQLIIYVDSFFCSRIGEGAWTAISNANRLVQLPLGVLITAMLVPMLPRFTEQASAQKIDELKVELRRALSFLLFLAVPLSTVLLVLAGPIIRLLFQRGAFSANSTHLVTAALLLLIPSIIFYIGRDLITRVFYAFQDSRTPFYVAMLAIVVKIFFDWLFVVVYPLGVGGISLATSLITIFNLCCLSFLLKQKIGPLGLTKLLKPLFTMAIAAALSGLIIAFIFAKLQDCCASMSLPILTLKIGVATVFGATIYFVTCSLLGLEEPKMLTKRLLKR